MTNSSHHLPYNILTLDGGAMRGILTTVLLVDLEKRLLKINPNKPLQDYFQIIAGTSTGSLIACGLAKGLTAQAIQEIYWQKGIEIFPKMPQVLTSLFERIWNQNIFDLSDLDWFNWFNQNTDHKELKHFTSQPIYDGKGLEKTLKDPQLFGNTLFGQLPQLLLITSYDVYNRQAVIFKNDQPEFQTLPVWEVCRASAAAPVAFPAHLTNNPVFLKHLKATGMQIPAEGIPLIDGGVVASNPSLCAIAEGRKKFGDLPTMVASFGTGDFSDRITVQEAQGWGVFNWTSLVRNIPLMDVFSDGSNDAVDYVAKQLLTGAGEYLRFQPQVTNEKSVPVFVASEENLQKLTDIAEEYIQTKEYQIKIERLLNLLNRFEK